MRRFWYLACLLLTALPARADEQGWINLTGKDLSAWKTRTTDGTGAWFLTDKVTLDPQNPRRLAAQPTEGGILVNGKNGRTPDLITPNSSPDSTLSPGPDPIPTSANNLAQFLL